MLTNDQLFKGNKETFTDPDFELVDTVIAKFLLEVQNKFTNEEHARLNVEIAVLNGPYYSARNFTSNTERGSGTILQKGFRSPYGKNGISFPQDFAFTPIKEEEE